MVSELAQKYFFVEEKPSSRSRFKNYTKASYTFDSFFTPSYASLSSHWLIVCLDDSINIQWHCFTQSYAFSHSNASISTMAKYYVHIYFQLTIIWSSV